jgi:uncharacterized protein YlxW (UPF0749 family)
MKSILLIALLSISTCAQSPCETRAQIAETQLAAERLKNETGASRHRQELSAEQKKSAALASELEAVKREASQLRAVVAEKDKQITSLSYGADDRVRAANRRTWIVGIVGAIGTILAGILR